MEVMNNSVPSYTGRAPRPRPDAVGPAVARADGHHAALLRYRPRAGPSARVVLYNALGVFNTAQTRARSVIKSNSPSAEAEASGNRTGTEQKV